MPAADPASTQVAATPPPNPENLNPDWFSLRLLAAAAAVLLLAWGLLALDVWHQHAQRIEHAGDEASSLARAVEQRVTRTLRVTDQMLKLAREEVAARNAWNDPGKLSQLMAAHSPNMEEILTVSFVTPDGVSLAHSNPAIAVGIPYTSSDFYLFHSARKDDTLYVERPIVGRASGQRIFTVSRALRDRNGTLRGIIIATLRTDILAGEFASLRIGPRGAVGVHHLDSYRIIAREPDHQRSFGRKIDNGELGNAADHAPSGIVENAVADDGIRRFSAYRKLDGLPLAVTVGIARDDIAAELWGDLAGYLLFALGLTLAIAIGTALLLRAQRREVELRQHLAETNALLKAFFDAAPAGMCTLDRNMRYQMVNPAMARMNGKELAIYSGSTVGELVPGLLGKLTPIHRDVFASGRDYRDIAFSGPLADRKGSIGYWQASFFPVPGPAGETESMGCFVVDVTAQHEAEEALRNSEALLAKVLEVLPVGVSISDAGGRIILQNPAIDSLWQGRHAVREQHAGDYRAWHADTGQAIGDDDWALTRALRENRTTTREMLDIECFDGTRRTILNSALPLRAADGTLTGAIAVQEDVTDMRLAEESVRLSRDFFEQTFNAPPVAKAVTRVDGHYTKVNRSMVEFLGYREDELLQMTFMDATFPDDLQRSLALRDDLVAARIPSFQTEKRYLRKDGQVVWGLLAATVVRDHDGKPLYLIAQTLDIDRQKQAEQSLRESEARFRAIFDNAITGIGATDDSGRVLYFNEALRNMLGYETDELRQMNFADFTHPDDLARELRILDEIRAGRRDSYRMEKRYMRKDGSLLWIDLSSSAVRDADGSIRNFIAVIHDVTESKDAELALTRSRQKLRALAAHQTLMLEEERKHIAREIHDELGQLLTALKMNVSLLRMNHVEPPALRERIEAMGQLVDDTMAVVRQVASNLRPAAIDLGLLPAIEWLAEDFSARWEIECSVECSDGDIVLNELLATTVFRVVQESLTNVARHAEASKVSISLHRNDRVLHVVVHDNGCGFDMSAIGAKKTFGFLGMRERVLSVGGSTTVDSAPGMGTTVSITLPIRSEVNL